MVFIRTANNYNTNDASTASGLSCPEKTLTQQQFKEQASIQNIVDKYLKTGIAPINTTPPLPEEYLNIIDFHDAMNIVKRGEQSFMELPSVVRKEFSDDPGLFLNALNDPAQQQRLTDLGVFIKPEEPPQVQSSPVAEGEAQ
jgi:hypothetical protein